MKRSNRFSLIALSVLVVLTLSVVILARRLSTTNDTLPARSFKVENFDRLPFEQLPFDQMSSDKNLPPDAPYFVNVAEESGLTGIPATEVCWVDANNDGYWDVYLERELLLISAAGKSFSKVETGFEFPIVKRVVPLNAARIDLSNVKEYRRFQKQKPKAGSYDDPELFGPTFAVAIADYNNDGCLDLLIASGDYEDGQFLRLYPQLPDQRFVEATEFAGFRREGSGGLSIGDYDRDGDIDILVGRSFARMSDEHRKTHLPGVARMAGLFQNRLCDVNGNHWLNLRLVGKGAGGANRFGIGARAWVTTDDGITQMREIRCGSGLSGHQDPPELHFGLGKYQSIKRLVIRWPNKTLTEQVFNDVPANQMLVIHEE